MSRYTRARLGEIGADLNKVVVLPGGVADEWFQLERKAPGPGDAPILLTVARLDEHKGHDMVIRALPAIRQRNPKVRYVMIGPGQENWPRLEPLAAESGVLDMVEYRGTVSAEALRDAYSRATVFIMASREIPGQLVEGFGLTFLEAGPIHKGRQQAVHGKIGHRGMAVWSKDYLNAIHDSPHSRDGLPWNYAATVCKYSRGRLHHQPKALGVAGASRVFLARRALSSSRLGS